MDSSEKSGVLDEVRASLREAKGIEAAAAEQAAPEIAEEPADMPEPEGEEEIEGEALEASEIEDEGEAQEGISTINELIEQLGWEPKDLYGLKKRVDLGDGRGAREMTLGELFDDVDAIEARSSELERERAAIAEQSQALQQQMAQVGQMNAGISKEMLASAGRMQVIEENWQALEADWDKRKADPQQAGIVANERADLVQQYATAKAQFQQAQQVADQQQGQAAQQYKQARNAELVKVRPDFAKPEKARELEQKLVATGARYQISPQEIEFLDHRIINALLDAADGVASQEGAKSAVARLKKAPSVLPRGMKVAKGAKAQAKRAEAEAMNKAISTGRQRDKLAAARAVMQSSRLGARNK